MIEPLLEQTEIFAPLYSEFREGNDVVLLDPQTPRWIAVCDRGTEIIRSIGTKNSVGEIVRKYQLSYGIDSTKAWIECTNFLKEVLRSKFIGLKPRVHSPYFGREGFVRWDRLRELWLHTNNSCNLSCEHCLVSSSPGGEKGLPTEKWISVIHQAYQLGVKRFFMTGGEPFLRDDIFELIDLMTDPDRGGELTILTNAMLFSKGGRFEKLKAFRERPLTLQVSLDGATAEINDRIRGEGCYRGTLEGIKLLQSLDFEPVITMAVADLNAKEISLMPRLLQELGLKRLHLMWIHRKGRMLNDISGYEMPVSKIIEIVKETKRIAGECGIEIDNFSLMRNKVNQPAGTQFDLSSAGYTSLCVGYDGLVYPSASFVGERSLASGSILEGSLKEIWRGEGRLKEIRSLTLEKKGICRGCSFKFICGGGDLEHGYFYSADQKNLLGHDPYCELYQYMIQDSLFLHLKRKKGRTLIKSGYDSPRLYHAMGEDAAHCASEPPGLETSHGQELQVYTSRSNCVLSNDLDRARNVVAEFYGKAAETPQEGLCCPTTFDPQEIAHIPKQVIDRFYGCGGPVSLADLKEGEVFVDLGSGGGIDCFIASLKVGSTGKVIGIDMTDQMLKISEENKTVVSEKLGYSNIEFKRGFLEEIPVESATVDVVTSNCVINLSPDKKAVFHEIWRLLKDHGRVVISDIVTEEEIPNPLKMNPRLWGECLSGALTENEFLSDLEQAGFYGIQTLKKQFWKEEHGYRFFSITVRGYKFEKKKGCQFIGQKAIYRGPYKSVVDEEGHLFVRDEIVEICTDTAVKLSHPPYQGNFTIVSDHQAKANFECTEGCC